MKKFYLLLTSLTVFILVNAQDSKLLQDVTIPLYTQNSDGITESPLILVQKGSAYHIQGNFTIPAKRSFFSKLLKTAGIVTATYQSERLTEAMLRKSPSGISNNKNVLLPLGLGVAVSADRLAPRTVAKTFIRYSLYNLKNQIVSEDIIPVGKNKEPIVISGEVPVDGYLKVQFINSPKADIHNGNINVTIETAASTEDNRQKLPADIIVPEQPQIAVAVPEKVASNSLAILPKEEPKEQITAITTSANVNKTQDIKTSVVKPDEPAIPSSTQTASFFSVNNNFKRAGRYIPVKNNKDPKDKNPLIPIWAILPSQEDKNEEDEPNNDNDNKKPPLEPVVDDEYDYGNWGDSGGGDGSDSSGDGNGDSNGDGSDSGSDGNGDGNSDSGNEGDPGTNNPGYSDPTVIPPGEGFQYTDPETGETYIIYIEPGESLTLDDGVTVTRLEDGSYETSYSDNDVVVTAYTNANKSGVSIIDAFGVTMDIQDDTFASIGLITKAEGIFATIGRSFSVVAILAGGIPAAINLLRDLYNGNQINMDDVISLSIAILAAIALGLAAFSPVGWVAAIAEFISFLLSLGSSFWDIWKLLHP